MVYGKLNRYPNMQLARMDDVGGCRLIFPNIDELYDFRCQFHRAWFRHKRRNDVNKYNYIENPKASGYYVYNVGSKTGRRLKGLMVELQYRTKNHHAWATAVEVIEFTTESQPKFQEGDTRYQDAMALASEILARKFEGKNASFPSKDNQDLVEYFLNLDKELRFLNTLRGLNASDPLVSANRNTILLFSQSGELDIKTYRDAPEALRALFDLERKFPERNIVLFKADTLEEVRFAFKNYLSDAQCFVRLIEDGCQKLAGRKIMESGARSSRRTK